jgi:hypothetical protein
VGAVHGWRQRTSLPCEACMQHNLL